MKQVSIVIGAVLLLTSFIIGVGIIADHVAELLVYTIKGY